LPGYARPRPDTAGLVAAGRRCCYHRSRGAGGGGRAAGSRRTAKADRAGAQRTRDGAPQDRPGARERCRCADARKRRRRRRTGTPTGTDKNLIKLMFNYSKPGDLRELSDKYLIRAKDKKQFTQY